MPKTNATTEVTCGLIYSFRANAVHPVGFIKITEIFIAEKAIRVSAKISNTLKFISFVP